MLEVDPFPSPADVARTSILNGGHKTYVANILQTKRDTCRAVVTVKSEQEVISYISRGCWYGQVTRKYRNGCLLSMAYILFRRQRDDTAYYDI